MFLRGRYTQLMQTQSGKNLPGKLSRDFSAGVLNSVGPILHIISTE